MAIHNITKNHFSVVVKKVRAAVLRANYLANGHAQRLILKLIWTQKAGRMPNTNIPCPVHAWLRAHVFSAKNEFFGSSHLPRDL